MQVERASANDVPAVEALLAEADLPLAGAAEAVAGLGVVARDEAGAVIGAAAVERFGASGLLRSVVVAPDRRGAGIGRALVDAAEAQAREAGIGELFLITETAEAWFPRLGYERVMREAALPAVGASVEFTMACSVSGVVMRRTLA